MNRFDGASREAGARSARERELAARLGELARRAVAQQEKEFFIVGREYAQALRNAGVRPEPIPIDYSGWNGPRTGKPGWAVGNELKLSKRGDWHYVEQRNRPELSRVRRLAAFDLNDKLRSSVPGHHSIVDHLLLGADGGKLIKLSRLAGPGELEGLAPSGALSPDLVVPTNLSEIGVRRGKLVWIRSDDAGVCDQPLDEHLAEMLRYWATR